jgi:hypothetical protein
VVLCKLNGKNQANLQYFYIFSYITIEKGKNNLQSTETAEKAARFLDGVILDAQACLW